MSRISRLMRTAGAVLLGVSGCSGWGLGAEREVADATRADASRFVHHIKLLDEQGAPITAESTVPYSPRQTCSTSKCHDYEEISKGTHTRMFPNATLDPRQPPAQVWTLFESTAGVTLPLACGCLAAKDAAFNPKVQLTVFAFARRFGGFHPGGGPLETDSEGKRYDVRQAEDPKLATTASREYANAEWPRSGVLENDCMACHALNLYDHVERAIQIDKGAFKWAPAVGMGFVAAPGEKYKPGLFDSEGKVHLEVGRPPDRNCLFCHRRPALGDTTWRDGLDADVHSTAGITCFDCHACGADHVMAGDRRATGSRDFASLTCKGCHESGRLGSPIPQHRGLPRLHLAKISCEACHAGPRPRSMPLALEQPTDPKWGIRRGVTQASGPTVFAPVLARNREGQIQSSVRMLPAYYAQKTPQGLAPLDPRSLGYVFGRLRSKLQDDNGDQQPEVNTDAEIVLVLKTLKRPGVEPVYVVGGRAYQLADKDQLTSEPNALGDPIDQPLAHNVRPAAQALGAEGCTECHVRKSAFFLSLGPTRAIGPDGKPQGQPAYIRLGKSARDLALGELRERYLRPIAPWVFGFAVLAMLLHYILFGPRRVRHDGPDEEVLRFNWFERLMHFGLLVSFVVLVATGLGISAGVEEWVGMDLNDAHNAFSTVLVVSAALALVMWFRDMFFSRLDWGWIKVMGGYLGYKGHVPAGRFNAGQRFLFWLLCLVVACLAATGWAMMYGTPERLLPLAYTLHDLCANLMILCMLGHVYLGSFANPGTLRAMFEGRVSLAWLKHHHPDYEPKAKKTS